MNLSDFAPKKQRRTEPSLNMPVPQPPQPPSPPRELHKAAQEAAVIYSQALERAEALERELADTRAHLEGKIRELENLLDLERRFSEKLSQDYDALQLTRDKYMRYAVTIRTHLDQVIHAAVKANEAALQAVNDSVPPPAPIEEVPAPSVKAEEALKAVEEELMKNVTVNPTEKDLGH